MLERHAIAAYSGPALLRDVDHVFIQPHPLLAPYLSGYMVSAPHTMPAQQIIIPSASATLVYAIGESSLYGGLRGVNTKPKDIAGYARQFDLLVLIEFHPAGLYPFLGIGQSEMLDTSFGFSEIDTALNREISCAIEAATDIEGLIAALDAIWLARLGTGAIHPAFQQAHADLLAAGGQISSGALAASVYYSEKQLGRLFRQHLGAGVKTYARILRMRSALRRIEQGGSTLAGIAQATGYYDEAHLLHELEALCGVSARTYCREMSLFYNDPFKP